MPCSNIDDHGVDGGLGGGLGPDGGPFGEGREGEGWCGQSGKKIHTPPVRVQVIPHSGGASMGVYGAATEAAIIAVTIAGGIRLETNLTATLPGDRRLLGHLAIGSAMASAIWFSALLEADSPSLKQAATRRNLKAPGPTPETLPTRRAACVTPPVGSESGTCRPPLPWHCVLLKSPGFVDVFPSAGSGYSSPISLFNRFRSTTAERRGSFTCTTI